MGFGLSVTSTGKDGVLMPVTHDLEPLLSEARIEMELSKPTRYAIRFDDDLCGDEPVFEQKDEFKAERCLGVFAVVNDELECLVYGPVTEVKSAAVLGGAGSWVEVHGEDRRVEMARVGVTAKYTGKASDAVAKILRAHKFEASTQPTIIQYDDKNALTQSATDLAFVDDLARRNNMEFWISYKASRVSQDSAVELTETANFRTSPPREQPGPKAGIPPHPPKLSAPNEHLLKVNPPGDECPTVNRFQAKINYERPTAARGFAMTDKDDQAVVEQIVESAGPPLERTAVPITGVERTAISAPKATDEEAFLAKEALVNERSWFVEVECSSTLEQLDFLVRPHQIVQVANAGPRLSGAYQVMKALHVVTASDHFMDFTLRANGLGQPA